MEITPDWQATRISHLDLLIAWDVCTVASRTSGAITKVATDYHLPPSIIQKALDRVEKAMGGQPFFVLGRKRTSRLSPVGERFMIVADELLKAWTKALSPGTTPAGPAG
jgi:DNA-binding transcriptional LysR family regulator